MAGGTKVAEYATVQGRVGEASASLAAAEVLDHSELRKIQNHSKSGKPFTLDQRIQARLSQAFSIRLTVRGIDAIYGATGGAGLYLGHRIQRAWRDTMPFPTTLA